MTDRNGIIKNKRTEKARGSFNLRAMFLFVLVLGGVAAIGVVFLLTEAAQGIMQSYISGDRWKTETEARAAELQEYITENNISSYDKDRIDAWSQSISGLYLNIYTKNRKIYESDVQYFEKSYAYTGILEFTDTVANVRIFYVVKYSSVIYAFILFVITGVIVFLTIVMSLVGNLIRDIDTLEEDIKILEGGGLDHEIKVTRGDELGSLQRSLDDMRIAFLNNYERDEKLTNANSELVKRMAHDLRTPLTSLMLYLDLLDRGEYDSEEMFHQYLKTASDKAERIHSMSDRLFEHSLISGTRDKDEEEGESAVDGDYDLIDGSIRTEGPGTVNDNVPAKVRSILEDELSILCMTLEANGFTTDLDLEWPDLEVKVSMEYIDRIMDNIYSNIIRYADKSNPVIISVYCSDISGNRIESTDGVSPAVTVSVANRIGVRDKMGSRIGLENIDMMLKRMGGSLEIKDDGQMFELIMPLPAA